MNNSAASGRASVSHFAKVGVRKLPVALGGGILGVAVVGLAAIALGLSLPIAGEWVSALVGMAVASYFA